jgi:hypothetical protein
LRAVVNNGSKASGALLRRIDQFELDEWPRTGFPYLRVAMNQPVIATPIWEALTLAITPTRLSPANTAPISAKNADARCRKSTDAAEARSGNAFRWEIAWDVNSKPGRPKNATAYAIPVLPPAIAAAATRMAAAAAAVAHRSCQSFLDSKVCSEVGALLRALCPYVDRPPSVTRARSATVVLTRM